MNRQFLALRGIAITIVVLNHAIGFGLEFANKSAIQIGLWQRLPLAFLQQSSVSAVPIFLFLSGCFFAYASSNKNITSVYRLVWTNIKHILCPYLVWSVLFYLYLFLLQGQVEPPITYFKYLFTGYPYNFIPLIIFYYLLSPLIIPIAKNQPLALLLAIFVYQLLVLNAVHPGILGFSFTRSMVLFEAPILRSTLSMWAIFFPLGLVYNFHMKISLEWARRIKWLSLTAIGIWFGFGLLPTLSVNLFFLAGTIWPVFFLGLAILIQRNKIPFYKYFEIIGKRAYGLYFMHLIAIDLILRFVRALNPRLLAYQLALFPVFFGLGLLIPIGIMFLIEHSPRLTIYRYVFG